ncbi:MAG: Gfo/Idh/MocA family oxidoreductase [Planctomycetota bacterium]
MKHSADPRVPPFHPARREFLAGAAALAGAGVLGSCSTIGGQRRAPAPRGKPFTPLGPGETIRMGVIGTGGMGSEHARSICRQIQAGVEKVQIVAVSDVALTRMERCAKECSESQKIEVAQYQYYKDLLARDDIHGVLIASPEHWHAPMAIDAILAGKDVYCEKPMTYDLDDAVRLMDAVHANSQILQVGTQYVMLPKYAEARKQIAAGVLGKPLWSQTSYCRNTPSGEWNYYGIEEDVIPGQTLDWEEWCRPLGPAKWDPLVYFRWRRYSKYSTGIIGDLLVHMMTPLIWAIDAGWPIRIDAVGGHYVDKEMDNFDQVNLTIQFDSAHTMIVAGATNNETGLEVMVRGNKANMLLGGNNVVVRPERPYEEDVDPFEVACEGIDDQPSLRANWWQCMRTREPNKSPVDLGFKVMVIVDLAHRSMWDGHAYAFDPATLTAKRV